MAEETNGIEPGFRITLGTIYTQLQEQGRLISSMDTRMQLQQAELMAVRGENDAIKKEQAALRSRLNGIVVSVVTGLVVGIPALVAFLK